MAGVHRWRLLALIAVVVASASIGPVPLSLALTSAAAGAAASFGADVLDPPTGLTAAGGPTAVLAWTPTLDAYAQGYRVYRASASSGPFAAVGSVTPSSAVGYVDAAAGGSWFYTVRSFAQGWESIDAGPVSATIVPAVSTGFAPCTTNAADTTGAGDNNGYQSNAANACAGVLPFAADASSGTGGTESCGTGTAPNPLKDRHRFGGFGLGVPLTASTIDGIEVQVDLGMNNNGNTTNTCVQLSWDGGTAWTAIQSQPVLTMARTTYTFGSTIETWGRAWTAADLAPGSFVVRLIDASAQTTKTFQLYRVAVQVTYTP